MNLESNAGSGNEGGGLESVAGERSSMHGVMHGKMHGMLHYNKQAMQSAPL